MIVNSAAATRQATNQNPTGHDAFRDLDLNSFLSMMIAELQNQDPLNPMDNAQLLQQVSQIREIESNLRLVSTLESLVRAESLASGTNLIGRTVKGLDTNGKEVVGVVEKVSADEKGFYVHFDNTTVSMRNIKEVI
ncbi:MAG: flagellar hook capping FlgD N-terminal domain-containing protein [Thermogutta sp.]|nr:flagellar hook capping FlgD N-terminal domain-containing protein [Thermogutta sp.]HOP76893.1 flagellar hook capping FlgD N-terminal domain-containing protein [Thermogutta sp.]HPU05453.1 flagellar hook capping FlgD N-terminal domain-containing protein [Thermogutta sp.]